MDGGGAWPAAGESLTDLKPCPFCGETHALTVDDLAGDDWYVECGACKVQQHAIYPTCDAAIVAWNRRAATSSMQQPFSKDAWADAVWSAMRSLSMEAQHIVRPMNIHTVRMFCDASWKALADGPAMPSDPRTVALHIAGAAGHLGDHDVLEPTKEMLEAGCRAIEFGWADPSPDYFEGGVIVEQGLTQEAADLINAENMRLLAVQFLAMLAARTKA
jgi:Lar family restriction alleviation protein